MAQLDPIQRCYHQSPKTPKAQTSPTFEQLLQGDSPNWQSNTSPSLAKNQDPEEYLTPQSKKSVFTKVKEKAKKLRHTLSGRKKNDYADGGNTPSWGVSLDDDEEDDEDPEYLGAPMYESEMAPENYKEHARQNPRAIPVVPEKHAAPSNAKHETEGEKHNPANKSITKTVSERLAPAYAAVSDATNTIASKVASLTTAKPEDQQKREGPSAPFPSPAESDTEYSAASDMENSEVEENATSSPQKWDKGVSVKEYFMNKLEPGEDERALSQVISDAISPKKSAGDKGVAEKVRAAVTSFLRAEEPSQSTSKETSVSVNTPSQPTSKERSISVNSPSQATSKETGTSANVSSLTSPKLLRQKSVHCTTKNLSSNNPITNRVNSSPPIPISTNAHEADEDENHGRILQAN